MVSGASIPAQTSRSEARKGVSPETSGVVRAADRDDAGLSGSRAPKSTAGRNAQILALHVQGVAQKAIAKRMRVSAVTVMRVIAMTAPDEMIPAPDWVPADMRDDYRLIAVEDGEEAAASWARNEKRMRQALRHSGMGLR